MLEKEIKNTIRQMYINRNWEKRVTDSIIEFVINFQKTYGEKYMDIILIRLQELKEIRKEFNNSKYQASSKANFIVFFKDIKDDIQFKYVLEHELFHFIQKEGSIFEEVPNMYKNILDDNIKILLFEEAFVQYFTARINNKTPEYTITDKNGSIKKYWLNKCYKDIVGYVEELEQKIGKIKLLDMYMDDKCYEDELIKFDNKYGKNAFSKYIEKICSNL